MSKLNETRVREELAGFSVGKEVLYELDKKVSEILVKAKQRASENGRRTVMSRDI